MTAKPLRVIPWLAVSSPAQATDEKESLPSQLQDILNDPLFSKSIFVDTVRIPGNSRAFSNFDRFVADCLKHGILDPERMYSHLENRDFDVLAVRDSTRLGREWGIFGELVQLIIDSGARIYVQNGWGWVDETNIDAFIMSNGFAAKKQVRDLVKYRAKFMPGRAQRGLNMGPQPVWSHYTVYDERGNETGTRVDRSRQRLWDDLATVILDGVAWNYIEKELYERFGHTDDNGKPFKNRKFYDLIHTPMFWGNGVWGYRTKGKPNKTKNGFWVFDPDYPPPESVVVFYGTYEAVYSGETAERVKGELRRRRAVVRGHLNPRNSKPFSGLLICDECYYTMSWFNKTNGTYQGYRCISVFQNKNYPDRICTQRKLIRIPDVQAAVTEILRELFIGGVDALYKRLPETNSNADRKAQLEEELANEVAYESRLRREQARKPESMAADYDADILDAHNKRLILESQLRALNASSIQTRDVYDLQVKELENLKQIGLERFWELPQTTINQTLHNVFGRFRLAVHEGEIVSVVPAPNYYRHPNTS